MEALLDKEKDILDNEGRNVRWHAADECCQLLARAVPCACKDLFDAARYGCEECCLKFIDQAGRTRNDIMLNGWSICCDRTALMVAARYGKTECVRILAEKEAGMKDRDNMTALMYATMHGHAECAEALAPREKGMRN